MGKKETKQSYKDTRARNERIGNEQEGYRERCK